MVYSTNLFAVQAATPPTGGATSANIARLGAYGKMGKMDGAMIESASKDFESMFMSQMLEQMFGESIGDDLFGNDDTKEIYKGLMMQEYGKKVADAGGIGIADYVKKELLRLQEV